MRHAVVPMIRVPDVAAAIAWYCVVGFEVVDTWAKSPEDGGEITWAELAFGDGSVMFSIGGHGSDERREMDLYLYVDDLTEVARRLAGHAEVLEDVHETFYGMRELIVRDLNGFWLTFGQRVHDAVGEDSVRSPVT